VVWNAPFEPSPPFERAEARFIWDTDRLYRVAGAIEYQDCQTIEKGKAVEKQRRRAMGLKLEDEPGLPGQPKGKTVEKR
jgi:hypothetical protein